MEFPLAHDESGAPISVPGNASGWLVRRHSGGRGRPGAVYDRDGRPLVIGLEATADDLRMAGCRPAMYRLDAVDDSRAQLGATAYTEVRRGDDADGRDDQVAGVAGGSDVGVAALARAVEAMQRVQAEREKASAERERVHAELIGRLIDRLAPAPAPAAPRNLTEVLDEHVNVTKRLDELAPPMADDEPASGKDAVLVALQPSLEKLIGILGAAVMDLMSNRKKKAGSKEKKASEEDKKAPKEGAREEANAESEEAAVEEADEEPHEYSRMEVLMRLNEVEARLSVDEKSAAHAAITSLGPEKLNDLTSRLMEMTVEEAVAEVRRLLADDSPSNGVGKSNGVSAVASVGGGNGPKRN